jgi:2-amino-4-hydroxy-6-hydroxymethyldihydropteridine diphosphokinase
MTMRSGLLGLGSNVGERREHLQAAVDALAGAGVCPLASSSTYYTDPVGEVLTVKRLERELGRAEQGVRHGPRAIDIDVLLLGEIELNDARMTLPHEQILARRFVLIPALELDFAYAVPDGRLLADALAGLGLEEGVRWAGPPLELPVARAARAS